MSQVTKSHATTGHVTVMRSQLAQVRGLGSARSGVHHWWVQRLTAIALVPLSLWFVYAVLALKNQPQPVVAHWIGLPINTVLLISLVVASFHHMQLGLQVVIEDYVHGDAARLISLVLVKGTSFVLGLWAAISVLRLAF
jgi:succinate dehydrogenase / fumarate reductase membrane anchor subunit